MGWCRAPSRRAGRIAVRGRADGGQLRFRDQGGATNGESDSGTPAVEAWRTAIKQLAREQGYRIRTSASATLGLAYLLEADGFQTLVALDSWRADGPERVATFHASLPEHVARRLGPQLSKIAAWEFPPHGIW